MTRLTLYQPRWQAKKILSEFELLISFHFCSFWVVLAIATRYVLHKYRRHFESNDHYITRLAYSVIAIPRAFGTKHHSGLGLVSKCWPFFNFFRAGCFCPLYSFLKATIRWIHIHFYMQETFSAPCIRNGQRNKIQPCLLKIFIVSCMAGLSSAFR